jgi:hypothetical protein
VFSFDGAVRVEELVGDVGEDGGAARGHAAFGDEDQEPVEEFVDVHGRIELREFGEEFRGEVFRVVLGVYGGGKGGSPLRGRSKNQS